MVSILLSVGLHLFHHFMVAKNQLDQAENKRAETKQEEAEQTNNFEEHAFDRSDNGGGSFIAHGMLESQQQQQHHYNHLETESSGYPMMISQTTLSINNDDG